MTNVSTPPSPELDIDRLRGWIGRKQEKSDVITVRMAEMFNAIFDVDDPVAEGSEAPAGIQWCLAPDIVRMSGLGPDGHPRKGGFLPPIPFPRRMWAGGELNFHGRFHVGDEVLRQSLIADVVLKTGRSGSLVFVTVRHDYRTKRGLVLQERQDIVYREQDPGAAAGKAPDITAPSPQPDFSMAIEASPTLLFRYSAITFNGHRIHYDFPYVTNEEFYPGLVVHGPLQATFLLKSAVERSGGSFPKQFAFRSVRPLFAGHSFTVNARKVDGSDTLWVAGADGGTTMSASITQDRAGGVAGA